MSKSETIKWLSYNIFKGNLNNISFDGRVLINTINQYSYCIAEKDIEFKNALVKSDILLPDGIGIVKAVKMMLNQRISKIAGADLHLHLLTECNRTGKSCFYLGSSDSTLNKIKERLTREYPKLKVGVYSPPYKSEFSDEDNQLMLQAVNSFKPDVLFIGMTAPKQEKWANKFKTQLNTHVICTIGAVFDFYAGTVSRPHKIWIDMGLEWFVRFAKEPSRMWKRYVYYGPLFLLKLSKFSSKGQTNSYKNITIRSNNS